VKDSAPSIATVDGGTNHFHGNPPTLQNSAPAVHPPRTSLLLSRSRLRRSPGFAAFCAAGLALAACKADTRPGTVAGDAYIVTESGQEVNMAGLPVGLVPETEQLDSLLRTLCPRGANPAQPVDSAAQARAWQGRARLLGGRAAKRASTDAAAHFRLDGVAPGKYRVWADTTYGGTHWTWLAPVTVAAGDTAKVALSNANPDESPFRCRD